MKIETALVKENEIAKAEDFLFGFLSIVSNSKLIDCAINRCAHDYVCGGKLYIGANGMSVGVRRIWANSADENVTLPVYSQEDSEPVTVVPSSSGARIDIVQARGILNEYDEQQRAFISSSGSGSYEYQNTNTKQFLSIDLRIKAGIPGTGVAPVTDTGFIKLGEIFVGTDIESLLPTDLRNVTAEHDGDSNVQWTTEQDKTFYLGSLEELVLSFLTEHLRNGHHKDRVIKQWNIDFGDFSVAGKVSGASIPLGKDLTLPQSKTTKDKILSDSDLYNALGKFAPTDSPAFTGTPTAPTASANTNNTQIATTAFVQGNTENTLTSTSTTRALSAAKGKQLQDEKAPKASPALTGTPTAPTPSANTDTTQIATTAWVRDALEASTVQLGYPQLPVKSSSGAAPSAWSYVWIQS
ncbi:MAG: hypothetical protein Ta2A_25990 [Treponemataceae bacterium]|nr:MAG: hypothetical protein Ta2A_25990 [Treponemataceae bacterium]